MAKGSVKAVALKKTVSTPVRNTAIPKIKPPAAVVAKSREISQEQIAAKAFEIYASGHGGSELDNWFVAERVLRQGI